MRKSFKKKKKSGSGNSISIAAWPRSEIDLGFNSGDFSIRKKIGWWEWKGLLDFLRKTKKRKNLPKGCEGYSGYDIGGQTFFYNAKDNIKRNEHLRDKDPLRWKKSQRYWLKEAKDVKKTGLCRRIYLDFGEKTVVWFERSKFIRFRKDFLAFKPSVGEGKIEFAVIRFL